MLLFGIHVLANNLIDANRVLIRLNTLPETEASHSSYVPESVVILFARWVPVVSFINC